MKNEIAFKERTLYWMILTRPQGSGPWLPMPYIPRKGQPANRFTSRSKAEEAINFCASHSNPAWCGKTKKSVPMTFLLGRVLIPATVHEPIPGDRNHHSNN